jgi:flagellar biosynthesis GTPase FlhF
MLIGDFSTDDFIEAGEAALALSDFKHGMPMLVDARASFAYASGEEMLKRVEWLVSAQQKGIARCCALVTATHRMEMMKRTAAKIEALGMEAAIFTQVDEAINWLRSLSERDET